MSKIFKELKERITNSCGWDDVFRVMEGDKIRTCTTEEQLYLQLMVNNSECSKDNRIITDYSFEHSQIPVCMMCKSPNVDIDIRFEVGVCLDCNHIWTFTNF